MTWQESDFTFIPPYPSTFIHFHPLSLTFISFYQLYLHSPVPVDLARLGILHVLHLLPAQSVQNLNFIFFRFFVSYCPDVDPVPLTLALHVPHPIYGPLSSETLSLALASLKLSKTFFLPAFGPS